MKYKTGNTVVLTTGEIVTIRNTTKIVVRGSLICVYCLGKCGELGFEDIFYDRYEFRHYSQSGLILIEEDIIKGLHMSTKFVVGDTVWYLDVTYNAQPKIKQDVILRVDNFDVYCLKYSDKTIHIGKLYPIKEDLLAPLEPEPHVVGYTCLGIWDNKIMIAKCFEGDPYSSIPDALIYPTIENLLKAKQW